MNQSMVGKQVHCEVDAVACRPYRPGEQPFAVIRQDEQLNIRETIPESWEVHRRLGGHGRRARLHRLALLSATSQGGCAHQDRRYKRAPISHSKSFARRMVMQ